ncbi:E3 SUMO-protein ligase ZNF451-like [Saccostrea echinata]|uniref:E3 SUMO-protein ligase ZNF451-like n=1 Tax=Saccostrea echinata TaxID=191078 RepID=UPI002A7EE024|nr:E3 SUMO-protein ligase ZNF451-like [Saccostrea echinata]
MCESTETPPRTYLNSVTARFEQQYLERQKKIEKKKCQREVELAHSQYLKQNVVDSQEMMHASFVVGTWSKKHGDLEKKWAVKDKREKQRIDARFSPYRNSPSSSRRQQSSAIQKKRTSTPSGNSMQNPRQQARTPVSTSSPAVISLDDSLEEMKMTGCEEHIIICPVLYCEVKFTSKNKQEQHMRDFDHSPINPCSENSNGVLAGIKQYICTHCGANFESRERWDYHHDMEGPCSSPKLLAVNGYLCPRTLSIFSSKEKCEASIQRGTSDIIKFPFKDDDALTCRSVKPCPVSQTFIDDFTTRCKSCPFSISCMDCGVEINDNESFQSYFSLTDQTHILTATTIFSKEEVFSEYITEYFSNFSDLSKPENAESKMRKETFSNFVKFLCHLLEENL